MVTRASVAPQVLVQLLVGADILGFNGVVLSVAGDVPVESEASAGLTKPVGTGPV